jgi:TatA/E family protein of Tat protein translocase
MPTPGPLELVIILVIALVILGPGKLPDVGASLGKSIKEFRKASSDIQEATTITVDTSPLPPQPAAQAQAVATPVAAAPVAAAPVAQAPAPVAPVVEAVAPVTAAPLAVEAPIATAAPYEQAAAPDVPTTPSTASRIEELERELAERRAELARSQEQVGAASGSSQSGSDAS